MTQTTEANRKEAERLDFDVWFRAEFGLHENADTTRDDRAFYTYRAWKAALQSKDDERERVVKEAREKALDEAAKVDPIWDGLPLNKFCTECDDAEYHGWHGGISDMREAIRKLKEVKP